MGLLNLGVLSSLLSESLISGFTTGAGIHVFTSQVPSLLGVESPKFTGIGSLVKVILAKNLKVATVLNRNPL